MGLLDFGGCRKVRVWGLSLVYWGYRRRRVRVNSLGTWRLSLGIIARVCVIYSRRGLLEDVSWRVTCVVGDERYYVGREESDGGGLGGE